METKNNKGFSLIEILVAMGLIGILAAIAVPAYDNYRDTANLTVLKSDAGNAYKAMHAYNAVQSSFCGDLDTLGLKAIKDSQTYTQSSGYFVGFGADETTACNTPVANNTHYKKSGSIGGAGCKLGASAFKFGVANVFGGDAVGYNISHDNNSPIEKAGGTCSGGGGGCTTRAKCIQKHTTGCVLSSSGTAGTWNAGALTDVCAP